ncbi:MAG TPA: methyl-accepting chemotaxis protein, partial [Caulobacteraceae bacterium]|nr:methyl-accepting chemotaxis protein [Caulobacteraceae bacterium]
SADAAKEIKALIAASTDQVGKGVRLVGDTGQALTQIAGSVGEIDGLVAGIAAAAQQQAAGLASVSTAVGQLDEAVRRNADLARESSDAAVALRTEVADLEGLVARFRLADEGRRPEPRHTRQDPSLEPRRYAGGGRY